MLYLEMALTVQAHVNPETLFLQVERGQRLVQHLAPDSSLHQCREGKAPGNFVLNSATLMKRRLESSKSLASCQETSHSFLQRKIIGNMTNL